MAVPLFPFGDDIRQLYSDAIDTILLYLGRPCKLVIPADRLPCPNCHFDSVHGRSSGRYNGTGPRPFASPPCPVCGGSGYDPASDNTVVIKTWTIDRDPRQDVLLKFGNLTTSAAVATVKGYYTDIPALLQAKYVILDYQNAKYTAEKYVLAKGTTPKPSGSIEPGRYFEAVLQQVE